MIYALFMRCEAAPWLPFVISVDEIDFTAPSRRSASSQDTGGNLWLYLLSDSLRPKNATFFATTNALHGVLEQLVDKAGAEKHYGDVVVVDYDFKDTTKRLEDIQGGPSTGAALE